MHTLEDVSTEPETPKNEQKEHKLVTLQNSFHELSRKRAAVIKTKSLHPEIIEDYRQGLTEYSDALKASMTDPIYRTLCNLADQLNETKALFGVDGGQFSHLDSSHQYFIDGLYDLVFASTGDRFPVEDDIHHPFQLLKLLTATGKTVHVDEERRDTILPFNSPSLSTTKTRKEMGFSERISRLSSRALGGITDYEVRDSGFTLRIKDSFRVDDLEEILPTAQSLGFPAIEFEIPVAGYGLIRDEITETYGNFLSQTANLTRDGTWVSLSTLPPVVQAESPDHFFSTVKRGHPAGRYEFDFVDHHNTISSFAYVLKLGNHFQIRAMYMAGSTRFGMIANVFERKDIDRKILKDVPNIILDDSQSRVRTIQQELGANYVHLQANTLVTEQNDYVGWELEVEDGN